MIEIARRLLALTLCPLAGPLAAIGDVEPSDVDDELGFRCALAIVTTAWRSVAPLGGCQVRTSATAPPARGADRPVGTTP